MPHTTNPTQPGERTHGMRENLLRLGWDRQKALGRRNNSLQFARETKEKKIGSWKTYFQLFVDLAHKYHRYAQVLR